MIEERTKYSYFLDNQFVEAPSLSLFLYIPRLTATIG